MDSKINQITILVSQIQNVRTSKLTTAQTWMSEHVDDSKLKQIIPTLTVVGFHMLDLLDEQTELTGAKIAQKLGVTRSTITRAAQKMLIQELLITTQHDDNKKNIYYKLTNKGIKLAKLHQEMDKNLYWELQDKISTEFSEVELDAIIRFLTYIKDHMAI